MDKVGITEVAHLSGEETDSHGVGSLTQSPASKEQSWYTNLGQEDSRVCVLSSMPRVGQLQPEGKPGQLFCTVKGLRIIIFLSG